MSVWQFETILKCILLFGTTLYCNILVPPAFDYFTHVLKSYILSPLQMLLMIYERFLWSDKIEHQFQLCEQKIPEDKIWRNFISWKIKCISLNFLLPTLNWPETKILNEIPLKGRNAFNKHIINEVNVFGHDYLRVVSCLIRSFNCFNDCDRPKFGLWKLGGNLKL